MAFQLSPGVLVTEEDRTTVVPSVATTAGAFAGAFAWGPVDQVVTVDSENNLVERFGRPNDTTAGYFFTAANFLSYGNNLQIVRNVNKGTARNAVSFPTGSVTSIIVTDSSDLFLTTDPITVTISAPENDDGVQATGNAVLSTAGKVFQINMNLRGDGYSVPPVITFQGGGGIGATATASLSNGEVANITVTAGGNNYSALSNVVIQDATFGTQATANLTIWYSVSNVTINNGGNAYIDGVANLVFQGSTNGTQAEGTLVIDANTGVITGITITNVGSGYTEVPSVVINRNDANAGTDANITAVLGYGTIQSVNIVNQGTSYFATPNVIINKNDVLGLGGTNAAATARISAIVSEITVTNSGSGYTSVPNVIITRQTEFGAGAIATAIMAYEVDSVTITNGGSGYFSNPTVTIQSAGGYTANATANATITSLLITNEENYNASYSTGGLLFQEWAAKYPGTLGNSIRVTMADANSWSTWDTTYSGRFDGAPGTSAYATTKGGSNDELHVLVLDASGELTGTVGTVLEKFSFLSKASDAKNTDGSTNYYKDVINSQSKYIWWLNHPDEGTNWGSVASGITFNSLSANITTRLTGGVDGNDVSSGNILAGYSIFANDELYDVSLMPMGPTSDIAVVNAAISIAENRRDAMVFVSPPYSSVVNVPDQATRINTYRDTLTSSSFAVLDSGWKYQYDRYNDKYRYVPLNGDTAGLAARTDYIADPWFSPAGYNRGVLKNVVKLAYSPTKTDRDTLYKKGVNPVVTFPGQGTILFGDKTLLARPSAFDRINVRRLFIVLEKAIATAAKFQLFEFNDSFTRAQFRNLVEPFLRDVQGRRGITDFRVICDETNNTAEVVDRNEFVADIYIKPARAINFIQLNFIATRSGVSFEEVGA